MRKDSNKKAPFERGLYCHRFELLVRFGSRRGCAISTGSGGGGSTVSASGGAGCSAISTGSGGGAGCSAIGTGSSGGAGCSAISAGGGSGRGFGGSARTAAASSEGGHESQASASQSQISKCNHESDSSPSVPDDVSRDNLRKFGGKMISLPA